MWNDIDEYALAGLEILGPAILNGAIGAPVEVGILGEMIEPFARAIEAGRTDVKIISVACDPDGGGFAGNRKWR
jgi:hypothetical protein